MENPQHQVNYLKYAGDQQTAWLKHEFHSPEWHFHDIQSMLTLKRKAPSFIPSFEESETISPLGLQTGLHQIS